MWPEIKVSRVLGEVEHPEALFDIYLQRPCILSVSSLFTAGIVCTIPATSTVFKTYSDAA